MLSIISFSYQLDQSKSDAAVVLGAAVVNSSPTPVFEGRIRHAIGLYQIGTVKKIVLTGGIGGGDTLAESEVARQYCIERGVPEEDIFIETSSHSTRENLIYAKPILAEQKLYRVLIVSDPLHMRRAITMAHGLGIDAHPSPTQTSKYTGLVSKSLFLLRETYYYGRYKIASKLWILPNPE